MRDNFPGTASTIMELKDIAALATVAVGLLTLLKGITEFHRSTITKRLELFLSMRSRLREDQTFVGICELLEGDDPALRDISLIQKDRFIGFFEELAIMRNSGLIYDDVAFYMFGYYAILCSKSKNYWHGLDKDEIMWTLFFDFASDMERLRDSYRYDRTRLKIR